MAYEISVKHLDNYNVDEVIELLEAFTDGTIETYGGFTEKWEIGYNSNSDNTYAYSEDYPYVWMRNPESGDIEQHYWLGYHGYEGFIEDLIEDYNNGDILSEDWEELFDICDSRDIYIDKTLHVEKDDDENFLLDNEEFGEDVEEF